MASPMPPVQALEPARREGPIGTEADLRNDATGSGHAGHRAGDGPAFRGPGVLDSATYWEAAPGPVLPYSPR